MPVWKQLKKPPKLQRWSEVIWGWGGDVPGPRFGVEPDGVSFRGLCSSTRWPGWLTFGAWVTHLCLSLNPETITERHTTSATATPSAIVTCGSTVHTWRSVPLCLPPAHQTFYFRGKLISIYQPIWRLCKQHKLGGWRAVLLLYNLTVLTRSHKALLISVFHLQSSLCEAVFYSALLFVFVRGNYQFFQMSEVRFFCHFSFFGNFL